MRVRGCRVKLPWGWSKRKEQEVVQGLVKVWFGQFFQKMGTRKEGPILREFPPEERCGPKRRFLPSPSLEER